MLGKFANGRAITFRSIVPKKPPYSSRHEAFIAAFFIPIMPTPSARTLPGVRGTMPNIHYKRAFRNNSVELTKGILKAPII